MQTDTSYSPEQTIVSPPRFPNLIRSNKKTFSNRRRRKNSSPRTVVDSTLDSPRIVVDSTLEYDCVVDSTQKRKRPCTHTYTSSHCPTTYDYIATNEENDSLFQGVVTLRLVIAYYYRCVLRAPPECE